MQFTVLINQSRALEWGLNAQQAMLFAFLFGCPAWAETCIVDGVLYFRLSKSKICEELPLLTDKTNTVHKLLKSLELAGVIRMAVFDNESHVAITEKGALWNASEGLEKNPTLGKKSIEGLEKNPRGVGKKSTLGVEKNPTNQITIDQITKSNNQDHKNKHEYPPWFVDLLSRYPPRSGSNDKRKAFHAAQARLKDGVTMEQLTAAVDRYRLFVIANGRINTEYTMQAATFFGPGGHIENPWSIPNATNQFSTSASTSQIKPGFADLIRAQARQALDNIDREAGDPVVHSPG